MPKRISNGGSKTYNYTTRSSIKKVKSENLEAGALTDFTTNKIAPTNKNKKRERPPTLTEVKEQESDSDDDVPIISKKRKRTWINSVDSDDSDVENIVENILVESSKEKVSLQKKLHDSFKYEPNQTSNSEKETKTPPCNRTTRKQSKPELDEMVSEPFEGNWLHCKLEFLKPDKIRDAMKRRPDHPDYNPSTLYVPPDFYNSLTPAMRQWWDMKMSHFDSVLFFKLGQFYVLYHMDAAVGVNELGLTNLGTEVALCNFKESAYPRMASNLVSKGFKVARVEQTETPEMMQERCKRTAKPTKFDKVMKREICQLTVRGTQVCGLQDPDPLEFSANYMLSVADEDNHGIRTYGVCFVDTSIGLFHIGQFQDDKHSSRLLTTLAHFPPSLIVYDRKTTSVRTTKLLSTHCYNARREVLTILPPEKTLEILAQKYYKANDEGDWPESFKMFLNDDDALGFTPAQNYYLAIKSLGGCVSYLTECLLDIQVQLAVLRALGMSQFKSYAPPDVFTKTSLQGDNESKWEGGNNMVLDAITLTNLRIVQKDGCLYDKLNFCSTPMGKRLLYQWVCAPSSNVSVIKERQEAVKALFGNQELCQDARNLLLKVPDLERLLAKVHALGNLKRSETHPDARAIFFLEKTYSKRKVLDFITVLNGFTSVLELVEMFEDSESVLLKRLTQFKPNGKFPDYREILKIFDGFNQAEAEKEGNILPKQGVDQEYDNILAHIKDIENEFKEYLKEQEKYFKCRLRYVGMCKNRYQIELPKSVWNKVGPEYHLESAKKDFKRFSTDKTKDMLSRLVAVEDQKTNILKDLSRRIFEKFSAYYNMWHSAVQCVANLDVLLSLAEFARQQKGEICLPVVTFDNEKKPYIEIVEGRHPCIPIVENFIPNDTNLGLSSLLLLTGPNMGGKSTLMRQVGLLTVLAHLGSYVPAQECRLSLVDRIFTRLGASDDILSGQSTFLVEMNETAAIVSHATIHSLVLLDELGRGTSTYDGTALASGVCVALAERAARTVFSTHYHSLVQHQLA